jgi:signal transduction histidine kinase
MPTEGDAARRPRRYRHRLRTRIVLSFVLLGTGLTALFAWATIQARQRVEDQLVAQLLNRNIDEYARRFAIDPRRVDLPVQQMYGRVVGPDKFDELKREYPDWYELGDGIHTLTGINPDGSPFSYKLAVRKTPAAWFFLAYDLTQSLRGRAQLNRLLLVAVGVFGLLSLLIGLWSASSVMSPVTELATRLRRSGRSAESEALAVQFPDDEVGELARALDDYAERLTQVVRRDREFNADVSHELRTPLAVIRGAVELMLAKSDLDERARTRLLRIQRAEQQCTDLISALLLLSRNERGHGDTDVTRVAEQLLDAHRAQLGGKALALRLVCDAPLHVDAPEAAIAVALGNLVGNAVKYTSDGSVEVCVRHDRVEVLDTGPGLSTEDAARLFERGYRGSHAGQSQGAGIGLSIVRRLCELYGWQARMAPRGPHGGVIATLAFGDGDLPHGSV